MVRTSDSMEKKKLVSSCVAVMLVGSLVAWGAREASEDESEPIGSLLVSDAGGTASVSVAEIGIASDGILLLAQNSAPPAALGASENTELAPEEEDDGESLLPDSEEEAAEDEGESLLPGGDEEDDGESLLPDGDGDGDGDSLLPDMDADDESGESLLPDADDSDLFPPGAADTVPTPEADDGSGSGTTSDPLADAGETAAAAHTTYLKWLQEEKRFPTAVTCAKCHPDHFAEWSVSAHAYSQMSPVFNSMHATLLKATSGTNGDFCIRCHTQIGMQREEKLFTSNLKRHPASIEGITCVVCHRVDRAYGKVSGRTAIVEGDLLQPVYGPKGNAILQAAIKDADKFKIQDKDIDGPRPVHAEAKKFDPIATSGFCGSCHDVNLLNGFRLEEAFSQFKNSPSHKRGENCQDCHMGVIPGIAKPKGERFASAKEGGENEHLSLAELRASSERDMNYAFGPAARVGDERTPTPPRKRTNHLFAGPDYSIIHPGLFPHSPELKDFTYQGRMSRKLSEAEKKAEEAGVPFDRNQAEAEAVAEAKEFSLADWLSFRWEEGWGTEAFEDAEKERARADAKAAKEGKTSGWKSVFAKLPAKEREVLVAAGWHDPDPGKWRKGARARKDARRLLDTQFGLLNRINAERHQIWRRGLQLGDFVVTRNDSKRLAFKVRVRNGTDGHGVPTGFDAERLIILAVTVRDRNGKVIFRSGDRDPNGDVRDLHSNYVHAGKLPIDKYLFNLQSKFLTRNIRGGEQEAVLAVNHSPDPIPYIRPDTRAGILIGRPAGARKHAKVLPPDGGRWAEYVVSREQLTGVAPYEVNVKVVAQMVPVNLITAIAADGFDYNLSPREVAKRVVHGHRVSPSKEDSDRRGGALTIWDKTLLIDGTWETRSLKPTEAEIMAIPPEPFPVQEIDPEASGGIGEGSVPAPDLPSEEDDDSGESLLPEGPGLIEDPEGGESLLPGDDSGEDLLPGGEAMEDEGGEELLPGGDPETGDGDGEGGEDLLPPDN